MNAIGHNLDRIRQKRVIANGPRECVIRFHMFSITQKHERIKLKNEGIADASPYRPVFAARRCAHCRKHDRDIRGHYSSLGGGWPAVRSRWRRWEEDV